ncbi:MAG: DUF3102 domain-containing protein [Clostridia bacterium]|nr:DUF3102 domain-containing protein [Clostridia bacterium]
MENIIEMDGEGLIEAVEIIPDVSGTAVATATGRSPEVIAAEINVIKAQTAAIIQTLGGQVVSGVYEIGRLLCEAKETVPRGEWGAWLETNVAYSDSTAQNFMRIYRELSDGQVDMLTGKTQAELFAGLDYSRMVEVFKLPKAERARLAEGNDLAGMSAREVKALVKEKRALEEKLEAQDDEIVELIGAKGRAELEAMSAKSAADSAEKAKNAAEEAGKRLQANIQGLEEALKKAESDKEKAVKAAEKAGKAQLKELQKELDELKKASPAAEVSAEDIERIKAEAIAEVQKKHEQELEQVRLEGMETVKDVRAEAEAEAEKRIAEMKQKLIAASDDTVKVVSVLIEQVSELLTKITERVESAPDEVKAKLSGAVAKLLTAAAESFASEE